MTDSSGGSRLRVVHIIETLAMGGAERMVTEIACRLDRRRFEPCVVALHGRADLKPRLEANGVSVTLVGTSPARNPVGCLRSLRVTLARLAPDLVHTHLYYANVMGRLAAIGTRARVVTTLHNPDYSYEGRSTLLFRSKKALDRFTGRRNAALVAVSQAVAADYERHMGWRAIRVIPNGIDVEEFGGAATPLKEVWPSPDLRLLAIGRLHPQKGHAVLLDALRLLATEGVKAGLVVAGEGPLREALAAQAVSAGLDGRVRLIGRSQNVRGLLAAAEVFVFPSLYEAFGLALLEAMAAGCPVVASRVGGIPEIVEDGASGLLVPPGDAAALAKAIRRLAQDRTCRVRLGAAARDRARRFDVGRTVEELERLYLWAARGRQS